MTQAATGLQAMSEQADKPHLRIVRADSPWLDYTGSAAEEQAGFHIAAEAFRAAIDGPASLSAYSFQGKPLLIVDKARRKVVVNAAVFSDLERPDMTAIAAGERRSIGTVQKPDAFARPADLAIFLLKAQIVRTYMHLDAKLRVLGEKRDGDLLRVSFAGTHSYCTNRCHEAPLRFAVLINLVTGLMVAEGE